MRANNTRVKLKSYIPSKNVWLNRKYIKIKRNYKLKNMFLKSFYKLHLLEKQAYKWKLHEKYKIHNLFHVLLFKQNSTSKRQIIEK